jgi:putative transposase
VANRIAEVRIVPKCDCYVSVILQEESYTSASNFLNLDPLPVYGQITEKPIFSGKRIKRGLYRTNQGVLVQSDVIGSYNILRKASPFCV